MLTTNNVLAIAFMIILAAFCIWFKRSLDKMESGIPLTSPAYEYIRHMCDQYNDFIPYR